MDREIALLLNLIDQAFDHKAWHGPTLRGSLRGMTPEQAVWRPGPGRHNAWEIAVHCTYWKYAVRRRLTGEKRGSFTEKGSNWFPRPRGGSDWKADLASLVRMHKCLRDTIAVLRAKDLAAKPAGGKVNNLALVTGIAAHDLYHAGQIQLLKRLRSKEE